MHAPGIRIAPSILAADFSAMGQAVREAEASGADAIHFDVMDGRFVPEISFGRRMVEALRAHTSLPMDVHLMVAEPQRHVGPFVESGASAITVHVEAFTGTVPLRATLERIRRSGLAAGVALKPATPAETIAELGEMIDRILVMTVEPGYAGQPFLKEMVPKIRTCAALARTWSEQRAQAAAAMPAKPGDGVGEGQLERIVVAVGVDGGIDERMAPVCVAAGATWLVAGSSVFNDRRPVAEGLAALRASFT